ncbi:MAG: serine/threonine protein kinase [Candidatus Marinimicrobia bacterium]|jgi:serine/threonine-protein kinase|nr:serine/threonine protein kinase [Candidatus Neomarinimicrobiota bacterium]MBT6929229.1 serine/threonine protein kinase [Candidatus Neomarinimicrobiota bacterium]MBT7114294.1 serine/threonine protein kinase [Candidatus Neomarinimicrobiota bacterium]
MINLPYTLGSYTVSEEIGRGGMGVVYRGTHDVLGRNVAVKMLNPQLYSDKDIKERFYSEAKLQASLIHPGLVTLYDFLEVQNNLFLIMELVEGRPLSDIIGKEIGPMASDRAIKLFSQVLDAFAYAHENKIVHRDAKPANLLVTDQDKVKVTDFGIAKIIGDVGLTQTGQKIGTPIYMSPEQVMGQEVDHRSDIYCLGITLYETLAGRLPIEAQTEFSIMEFHVRETPQDPRDFYPHIPDKLVDVIFKSIAKDPKDRFQSCDEMKQAMTGAAKGHKKIKKASEEKVIPPNYIKDGHLLVIVLVLFSLMLYSWLFN